MRIVFRSCCHRCRITRNPTRIDPVGGAFSYFVFARVVALSVVGFQRKSLSRYRCKKVPVADAKKFTTHTSYVFEETYTQRLAVASLPTRSRADQQAEPILNSYEIHNRHSKNPWLAAFSQLQATFQKPTNFNSATFAIFFIKDLRNFDQMH